jgi:hypothetical protein
MKIDSTSKPYQGGCHCGAVRFQVIVKKYEALECNCSICRKKGFLHLLIPLTEFTLISGGEFLTTYTFNTGIAKHTFCKICGIHPFYHPRSHPNGIDVNVRCLDEDIVSQFQIQFFDGVNWEKNIAQIQESSQDN